MSYLGGGKFGHGFAAAGFTQAFAGPIGSLDAGTVGFSAQRTLAAAVVGGTASELTGGKFANGALTGAFSRAFNDELHPFIQKTLNEFQSKRFWTAFAKLSHEEFRILFPNLSQGRDDFEIDFAQAALYEEFYSSGLASRLLEAAHDANGLLRDYSVARVSGLIGARGIITSVLGKAAGLSSTQMNLLNDVIAVKVFADQQGVNITQLSNLADTLTQGEISIGAAINEIRSLE